jgi:hypothetical protein
MRSDGFSLRPSRAFGRKGLIGAVATVAVAVTTGP